MSWLKRGCAPRAARWKLIGNQLMIMALDTAARSRRSTRTQWDGYGVERRELLEHIRACGIQNVGFLTGDIHTFFAGDVGVDGRGPESVATEFVGGSITSLGIPETLRGATGAAAPKEQFLLVSQQPAARRTRT